MEKDHIYFVPGLAASTSIFEYIQIPSEKFEIHYLDWLVPESKNETVEHYAKRMCANIKHKDPILVGVSFGGVMVQEMSKQLTAKKTIIISSIKSTQELPKRLRLIKNTKAYKLLPVKAITNIENFSKMAFGKTVKKRVDLYQKYLSMRDKDYLPWAVHTILHWKQDEPLPEVVHIHGNKDGIFPIKHVRNCKVVEGGTHIMIINKAKHISNLLQEVI